MKIVNVGYNYRHPDNFRINRPNGSGDYVLIVLRSSAFFLLNGKKEFVTPNKVILYKKGTPQFYGSSNGEFINDWIHLEFDEKEISRIENLGIPFDTLIPVNTTVIFSDFIKKMFSERYSKNQYKNRSLDLYFELILIKLAEAANYCEAPKDSIHYDTFHKLRNDIYSNPEKNWSIYTICNKLGFSRSYVQHLYKSFFGKTVIEDVVSSKIEYAKFLLSGTDMTICAVSLACGYNNDVHFMRLFKKTIGVTPTQYRKQTQITKNELEIAKQHNPFNI